MRLAPLAAVLALAATQAVAVPVDAARDASLAARQEAGDTHLDLGHSRKRDMMHEETRHPKFTPPSGKPAPSWKLPKNNNPPKELRGDAKRQGKQGQQGKQSRLGAPSRKPQGSTSRKRQ